MSNDREHDERVARLQRVLDRLDQVTKQAKDLGRMASELHDEASESIRLIRANLPALANPSRPKSARVRRKRTRR